jgi:hypothetical protein
MQAQCSICEEWREETRLCPMCFEPVCLSCYSLQYGCCDHCKIEVELEDEE